MREKGNERRHNDGFLRERPREGRAATWCTTGDSPRRGTDPGEARREEGVGWGTAEVSDPREKEEEDPGHGREQRILPEEAAYRGNAGRRGRTSGRSSGKKTCWGFMGQRDRNRWRGRRTKETDLWGKRTPKPSGE